jgi:RNA polymerase sigma-70 factor, ECF subfamily
MRVSPPSDQWLSVEAHEEGRGTSAEPAPDFVQLMEAEGSYVFASLRRLGVHPSDCEDLMQEVFIRVHGALHTFDSTRPVRPWLFGFAMRVASEHRRLARHKREVKSERDVPDARMGADDAVAESQRRRIVAVALESVDEDKRAVLVLHEFDEVPVPEIARLLGLAEGTAYSRLRAAREQFAAAIRRIAPQGGVL